jgi:c(7)-type cytochrome triheme protein
MFSTLTIKKDWCSTMKKFVFSTIVIAGLGFWTMNGFCTEQHDGEKYGPETLIQWNSPAKGVFFSHKIHTMGVGLDCASCHDDTFAMEAGAAEKKDDFTMAAMAEGKYCGNCHYQGGFGFDVNSNCIGCHNPPKQAVIQWDKPVLGVYFDHKMHADTMGFDCASCHDNMFAMKAGEAEGRKDFTMAAMADKKYCGGCHHDGGFAFTSESYCERCHNEPDHIIVWEKPVKGTVFDHKVHTGPTIGLDCESCHTHVFNMEAGAAEKNDDFTMAAMKEHKYCGACHYEGGFAYDSESRCASCHIGVKGVNRMKEKGDMKPLQRHQ